MEQELLPVVREGTYDSVIHSIGEFESDAAFVIDTMERIRKTNPYVCLMIRDWISDLKGMEFIRSFAGLCVLYRLLESEAEAKVFEQEMEQSNG
jgi:hypothetical protein